MSTITLPKYIRIKRQLIDTIESGKYPPGSAFPSEHQLLKNFDASRPTLIRSLQELVSEGYLTRQRGKGTFVANRYEQSNLNGTSPTHTNPFTVFMSEDIANLSGPARGVQLHILRGIQEALGNAYNASTIRQVQRNQIDEQTQTYIDSSTPGGALIIADTGFSELKQLLNKRGWRVWNIGKNNNDENCVYIDQEYAGYLATQYLIQAGRKKIALLNGPCENYWGFEARKQGYLQALKEAHITPDAQYMPEFEHSIDSEAGRTMMRQLLNHKIELDGVVGASDSKAMGAMAHAIENNIKVPEQIIFIAIDNTIAHEAIPALPAVAMPFEEMGYQAAMQAQTASIHRQKRTSFITQVCLRPSLVER